MIISRTELESFLSFRGADAVGPQDRFLLVLQTENGPMLIGFGASETEVAEEAMRSAKEGRVEISLDDLDLVEIID